MTPELKYMIIYQLPHFAKHFLTSSHNSNGLTLNDFPIQGLLIKRRSRAMADLGLSQIFVKFPTSSK